ncbi:MAG: type II toxin-antitoxin system VapC family toxin [Candidatus Poribacteria bacterium]
MNERCIDASVIVKLALKGESHRVTARRLVRESTAVGIELIAPPLFESEVDTVIRKRTVAGKLSLKDAHKAYSILDRAPVKIVTHPNLRQRARNIAEQFNLLTVYDATYAALAELRDCEFWTADKVFYDTVKAVLMFVKYLPNYP